MTPIEELDARFEWYEATRNSLRRIARIGGKFWADLPWGGSVAMERDNLLGKLEQTEVLQDATLAISRLDDLAIIELFSIFEGVVRGIVAEQVRNHAISITHPVLVAAAKNAIEATERRSFAEILNSYSEGGYADLAEQVRQIRRYRNWLAHGQRGTIPRKIEPKTAYQRLRQFLELLRTTSLTPTNEAVPDSS